MAGAGVADRAVGGIELDVGQGRGRRRRDRLHKGIEPLQEPRRARCLREGADGAAQLPHRHGGLQAVADDVPDDERHPARREREGVVPVATDLEGSGPRPVRRRDRDVLERRRPAAEQAELQRVRDLALVLVEHRVVEDHGRPRGDLAGEVVVDQRRPVLVGRGADRERAEAVTSRTERQDERRRRLRRSARIGTNLTSRRDRALDELRPVGVVRELVRAGARADDRSRRAVLVEQVDAGERRVPLGQHLDEPSRASVDGRRPFERLAEAHEEGTRSGGLDGIRIEARALDREAALLRDAEDDVSQPRAVPRPLDETDREDTEQLPAGGPERDRHDGLHTGSLPDRGEGWIPRVELGLAGDVDHGSDAERLGRGRRGGAEGVDRVAEEVLRHPGDGQDLELAVVGVRVHGGRAESRVVQVCDGRPRDVLHRNGGGQLGGVPLQELGQASCLTLGLEEGGPLERDAGLLRHADEQRPAIVPRPALASRRREDRADHLAARGSQGKRDERLEADALPLRGDRGYSASYLSAATAITFPSRITSETSPPSSRGTPRTACASTPERPTRPAPRAAPNRRAADTKTTSAPNASKSATVDSATSVAVAAAASRVAFCSRSSASRRASRSRSSSAARSSACVNSSAIASSRPRSLASSVRDSANATPTAPVCRGSGTTTIEEMPSRSCSSRRVTPRDLVVPVQLHHLAAAQRVRRRRRRLPGTVSECRSRRARRNLQCPHVVAPGDADRAEVGREGFEEEGHGGLRNLVRQGSGRQRRGEPLQQVGSRLKPRGVALEPLGVLAGRTLGLVRAEESPLGGRPRPRERSQHHHEDRPAEQDREGRRVPGGLARCGSGASACRPVRASA